MHSSKLNSQIPYRLLLVVIILQTLSHANYLPAWLLSVAAIFSFLVFVSTQWYKRTIHNYLRILLSLSSIVLFLLYFRAKFSVDMAASFLVLAALLKLLEIKMIKDVQVFVFTCLYLSAVSFLFEQGILNLLLQLSSIGTCLYVLFYIQCYEEINNRNGSLETNQIKTLLRLFLIALPFTIVFFLLFPRIAPIWHMPLKQQTTKVGISSDLSPGDISSLAKSSDPAFRVRFPSEVPERENLYWKGLILDYFDGRKWSESISSNGFKSKKSISITSQDYIYEIIIEPHQQLWAFALEGSYPKSSNVIQNSKGLIRFNKEIVQPTKYELAFSNENLPKKIDVIPTAYALNLDNPYQIFTRQDLQLPTNNLNPQTKQFVRKLVSESKDSVMLINKILMMFAQEQFYYSLEPGELNDNMVDEFLFQTQKGFCGHYASSMVYMLRLAGIPSRVAIGYQGGDFNQQGGYLLVSQFDAHAWVEFFIKDIGWVRVDPTAMVAPNRILGGSFSALANDPEFSQNNVFTSAASKFGAINWLRLRFDELNYGWQNLVINYHQEQQKKFLESLLGEFSLIKIAMMFVFLSVVLFCIFILWILFKRFSGYTLAEKKYMLWLLCLEFFGIKRMSGETPRSFLSRVQASKHIYLAKVTAFYTRQLEESEYRGNK